MYIYVYESRAVYIAFYIRPKRSKDNINTRCVRTPSCSSGARVSSDGVVQRQWHTGNHVIGFHLRRMRSLGKGKYVDAVLRRW